MGMVAMDMSPEMRQAVLDAPAMVPPSGVIPNFIDPPNLQHRVIVTLALCLALSTLTVTLRICTKFFIVRQITIDDYVVFLGWLLAIIDNVLGVISTRYGGGVHQWNVQVKNFFKMLYWVDLSTILYNPTLFVIKLSILLQYLGVFVPNRKTNMRTFIAVWTVIAVMFTFYLIDVAFNIFICRPRDKFWNPFKPGSCYSLERSMLATAFFNVFSDFFILLLPIPTIWRLQMALKRKICIFAVFATGMIACIMSIVRLYYTFQVVRSPDKTYHILLMGLWTCAEMAVGIIVSSLPVLPRLVQHIGPRISSAFSSEVKTRDTTPSQRKVDTRFSGEFSNWDGVRTTASGSYSSELPERGSTFDPSQASLAPILGRLDRMDRLDRRDPGTLSTLPRHGEQPPDGILRTIRIETISEPRVTGDSEYRLDIERQSLKSKR